jgi:hypothetical protein
MLSKTSLAVYIGVIVICTIIGVVSYAFLIPLDSTAVVTGVSIILGVAYALSILALVGVMYYYSKSPETLIWINTFMMFLVVLPTSIGATAMCVTSVQNARNLIASQTSSS